MKKDLLDRDVAKGIYTRKEENGLYGGIGKVTIYTYKDFRYQSNVYEGGYLLLEEGASIGWHKHSNDSEIYNVLIGTIESNGSIINGGEYCFCEKGESHYCKNLSSGETIIGFVKKR